MGFGSRGGGLGVVVGVGSYSGWLVMVERCPLRRLWWNRAMREE